MNETSSDAKNNIETLLNGYQLTGQFTKLEKNQVMQDSIRRMKNIVESRKKTYENLYDEYENQKYAPELNRVLTQKSQVKLDTLEANVSENSRIVIRVLGDYYSALSTDAHRFFVDIIAETLTGIEIPTFSLIELGAGEGLTLLPLLEKIKARVSNCIAVDLSPSGLKKINAIANNFDLEVQTLTHNIEVSLPEVLKEHHNSVVLTSFFLACLPRLEADFFQRIASLQPSYVFHFEPNYERLNEIDLMDELCREYTRRNNYNENFESKLRDFLSTQTEYEIFTEVEDVFGKNALLPSSVIGWRRKQA